MTGLVETTDVISGTTRARWANVLALCLAVAPSAFGACTIKKLAELHVTLVENRPLIEGQVNGQVVKIMVDTGSTFSFIREEEAKQLGLRVTSGSNVSILGVGGEARFGATVLKELQFGPFTDKNLQLAVVGSRHERRQGEAAFVLGEDFFSNFSTEFDFAHGAIRLLRLESCKFDEVAYWSDQYSLAELSSARPQSARIQTDVLVNGKQVDAILDTGAPTSIISLSAAKGAGIDPGRDGTKPAGRVMGLAGNPIDAWVATFGTFAMGDESVRNVKLQIADLFTADAQASTGSLIRQRVEGFPEMLVGADFFRTHRILVLFAERKLVFTYNGGPIFQTIEPDATAHTGGGVRSASLP
jgi:clan AA aspartic protease (TIGR02281 family)